MKFMVAKTSLYYNEKPCEEAKQENGIFCGDKRKVWTIEINSLEELLAFENKYGRLIITMKDTYNRPEMTIEIYDDYRE